MSLAGIDFAQKEPGLRSALLRGDVPGHGEPGLQNLSRVRDWSRQQLLEVLVFREVVVAGVTPLCYGLENKTENL